MRYGVVRRTVELIPVHAREPKPRLGSLDKRVGELNPAAICSYTGASVGGILGHGDEGSKDPNSKECKSRSLDAQSASRNRIRARRLARVEEDEPDENRGGDSEQEAADLKIAHMGKLRALDVVPCGAFATLTARTIPERKRSLVFTLTVIRSEATASRIVATWSFRLKCAHDRK